MTVIGQLIRASCWMEPIITISTLSGLAFFPSISQTHDFSTDMVSSLLTTCSKANLPTHFSDPRCFYGSLLMTDQSEPWNFSSWAPIWPCGPHADLTTQFTFFTYSFVRYCSMWLQWRPPQRPIRAFIPHICLRPGAFQPISDRTSHRY